MLDVYGSKSKTYFRKYLKIALIVIIIISFPIAYYIFKSYFMPDKKYMMVM